MKSKEEIITGMCYTYRHDYGIVKQNSTSFEDLISSGMTESARKNLYKTMEQLYNHHVAPLAEELAALQNGEKVVLPQNREHAVNMLKVAQFYLDNNS